jgi:acetyltransferase
MHQPQAHPLSALFDPTSVAVFGATARRGAVGYYVLRNLLRQGFAGQIVAINPKHQSVLGVPCHSRLTGATDRPVDLAIVASPAHSVPDILRDCAQAGTRHIIVISAGFAEGMGAGAALRDEILAVAAEHNLRFVGPNCLGLIRPKRSLNATFLNIMPPRGGLALVSQSGAICSAITDMSKAMGLGFSAILSLGNSLNVDLGDAIGYLAHDTETTAILVYVEGVGHAPAFLDAIRQASRSKPVIILKAGRHTGGAKAATTHTGAMIGADDVFAAAVERVGAVQVATLGQMIAAAEILSAEQKGGGDRLAIITNGGGAGVLAADRAGDLGLALPAPSEATTTELNRVLPPYWSGANPLDILGDATAQHYRAAMLACETDPAFDAILVLVCPQAMTDADAIAEEVLDARLSGKKPILCCFMGDASVNSARAALNFGHIPTFILPEQAVEAFSFLHRHRSAQLAARVQIFQTQRVNLAEIAAVRDILDHDAMPQGGLLTGQRSKELLAALGVPCPTAETAANRQQAITLSQTMGGLVSLKINSPDISHKSDVDGVRLKLEGAEAVGAAFDQITGTARRMRPDARILGVTVEPMVLLTDVRELMIGVKTDPVFGPVISIGAGGTMVEVLRDAVVGLPPLNGALLAQMIARTRVGKGLGNFRNLKAVDLDAVADVVLRVSDLLVEFPQIAAMDINPLFASPDGAMVVDARVELHPTGNKTRLPMLAQPS